jgi:hypothetical protein
LEHLRGRLVSVFDLGSEDDCFSTRHDSIRHPTRHHCQRQTDRIVIVIVVIIVIFGISSIIVGIGVLFRIRVGVLFRGIRISIPIEYGGREGLG